MMDVRFENGEIPIWKIRKGSVVRFSGFYYHVEEFYHTNNQQGLDDLKLILKNSNDGEEIVNPRHIEWLEPM